MARYVRHPIDADIKRERQFPGNRQSHGPHHEMKDFIVQMLPPSDNEHHGERQGQANSILGRFFERRQAGALDIAGRKEVPCKNSRKDEASDTREAKNNRPELNSASEQEGEEEKTHRFKRACSYPQLGRIVRC